MIRFACPGCGAMYSVDDGKAGKTGKCPKCQAQFVIPTANGAPPAPEAGSKAHAPVPPDPPPPPAIDPAAPVEIAPCPGCQARLSVAASDLGVNVECPYCRTVYAAVRPDAAPAAAPSRRPRTAYPEPDGNGEYRSTRTRARDDEDDDRPSRRRAYDDEDDLDDRPRKKKRKRRYEDVESKKLVAGLLAILLGAYGVHKFYLGYTGAGVLQIVITFVTCGLGGIIPLVEGIMYLTKSDEEFIETYQVGTKEWF